MEPASADRSVTFFRFEDLRIYHKALDYIIWVHKATSAIPQANGDDLSIKFNESARSIAMNIAEGSARNKSQFIYYLKMAKSSIRESLVFTTISTNLGYLNETQEEESRNFLMELTKMVGALISSLQRSSPQGNRHSEDEDEEQMTVDSEDYSNKY